MRLGRRDEPMYESDDEEVQFDEKDAERLVVDLLPHIPKEIQQLPREKQIEYVRGIIAQYQNQRKEPPPDRNLFEK